MAANGISTLTIPVGITADSHTANFLVEVGKFTYDAYGTGFVVRKDGGSVDAYMAQVLALPAPSARQYVFDQIDPVEARPFTYGQALISFTLNVSQDGNSTAVSNVVCTYGAGGYSASSGQLTMPGDRLIGGVSPANDIVWNYVCAGGDGVITSFTYASGTPPTGRLWTFVPANGEPSFTRAMNPPDGTEFSTEEDDDFAAIWNVTTNSDSFLQGTGANELDISLIPMGTEFNIYATELGAVGLADKEARQIAKLTIAEAKRQGKVVATNGTITGSIDPTKPYYRTNNQYDIAQLPTQYDSGDIVDNPNTGGLLRGRPWNLDTIITVIEEGLVLNLDARNLNSWSRAPGENMWYDLSGNNNHATVYGGIAYGEALGGALAFGGSDAEYAQCVPGVYFTPAGYTIQSWVYIISIPNWNRIIDFGSDAGSDNVLLSATLGTDGMPTLWVTGSLVSSSVQLLPDTGWHHVCATWTPTGNVGKVFIDGVLTGTATVAAPAATVRANCYIGKSNWGNPPDPNFNGGMGAIQIYSRALSDAEILSNYNTTKSYYGF